MLRSMDGRVVKASDLRSAGQSPRGFEPHFMQFFNIYLSYGYESVWRNWIARQTSNLKVAGSNPVMDTSNVPTLVSRGRLKIACYMLGGSDPSVTISFFVNF